MTDDNAGSRLRIGGWVPPYQQQQDQAVQLAPAAEPVGRRRPVYRPYFGPDASTARRSRLVVLGFVLAAGTLIAVAVTSMPSNRSTAAVQPLGDGPPAVFPAAAPSSPEEPSAAPVTSSTPRRPVHSTVTTVTTVTTRASSRPSRAVTVAPIRLSVGATVSLVRADRPAFRLRHRDFLARIDRMDPPGSAVDRADSAFVVRTGRADNHCFSFESVNYAGRYLRHRDFILHLDEADGAALFDQDSTFCPVPVAGGTALAFRSVNYPQHFLVEGNNSVLLQPVDPDGAIPFTVEPPTFDGRTPAGDLEAS